MPRTNLGPRNPLLNKGDKDPWPNGTYKTNLQGNFFNLKNI